MIPNNLDSLDYQTNYQELLSKIRGGDSDLTVTDVVIWLLEHMARVAITWYMIQNPSEASGYTPRTLPAGYHYTYRSSGPLTHVKVLERRTNLNDPGQGNCKFPSMNKIADSLDSGFREFQQYYPQSSLKRFDTNNYSITEFKELAKDPHQPVVTYDKTSINEARAIVQATVENKIIQPVRPDIETAKLIDLDFQVQGPAPYTHCDVKNPVGSHILEAQGQTDTIVQMSTRIGKKLRAQKARFTQEKILHPTAPKGSENVCHIIDLCYVPDHEKAIVRKTIIEAANNSDDGIIFLNDI